MTKRTRIGLFYILLVAFFVLGGGAVLYAEGWRVQFWPPVFDKIGGIYIKALPNDAEVSVDGKAVQSFHLFERGWLINNLFPGSYRIEVTKEGYHDWTSNVAVEQSLVNSHSKIVLVPSSGITATTTPVNNVRAFGGNLALGASSGVSYGGQNVAGKTILAGTDDGQRIITFSPDTGAYIWTDLQTGTSTSIFRALPRLGTRPPDPAAVQFLTVPDNGLAFIYKTASTLRLANMGTDRVTALEDNSVIAGVAVSASRIAWTDWAAKNKNSALSMYDLLTNSFLRNADTVPGKTLKMDFLDRDNILLLQDNHILYSVSLTNGAREELDHDAYGFELAPDGNAIAVLEKNGISVISERDSSVYEFFAIPEPQNVKKIIWYKDDAHAFIVYPHRTAFLDFGDTALENFITVAETPVVEYLPDQNAFYAVLNNQLLKFNFPG